MVHNKVKYQLLFHALYFD